MYVCLCDYLSLSCDIFFYLCFALKAGRLWVVYVISFTQSKKKKNSIPGKNPVSNTLQTATADLVESTWCWRCSISAHIDLPGRTTPMVSAACHSKSIKTGLEGWSKETGEESDSRSKRRAEETVKEKKEGRRRRKTNEIKKETFQGWGKVQQANCKVWCKFMES